MRRPSRLARCTRLARLAPLALLALAACGGGEPTATDAAGLYATALEKLARADRAGAVTDLEAAQSAIGEDDAHPDYWNVRLALAEAHVVDEPTEAQMAFLEVAGRKPGGLTAREYATFGQRLSDAKHYQQAVLVVDRGLDAHTAEAKLKDLMDRIKRDAQTSGDQGTLDLLESLGYL